MKKTLASIVSLGMFVNLTALPASAYQTVYVYQAPVVIQQQDPFTAGINTFAAAGGFQALQASDAAAAQLHAQRTAERATKRQANADCKESMNILPLMTKEGNEKNWDNVYQLAYNLITQSQSCYLVNLSNYYVNTVLGYETVLVAEINRNRKITEHGNSNLIVYNRLMDISLHCQASSDVTPFARDLCAKIETDSGNIKNKNPLLFAAVSIPDTASTFSSSKATDPANPVAALGNAAFGNATK